MLVTTEARQLLTQLRAALVADPANDAWNQLHLVSVKDHLLAQLPVVRARLEQCRDDPPCGATHPDHQAEIQALEDVMCPGEGRRPNGSGETTFDSGRDRLAV